MNKSRDGFILFLAVVAAGCSFQASCGGKKLNTDKAEAELARLLEEAGGLPAKVSCPEVKLEKGRVIECTTDIQGVKGRAKVTQTDDEGTVTFEPVESYAFGAKLEHLLGQQIKERTGVDTRLDCGERVRAAVAGARFRCTATAADGDTLALEITLTDSVGGFDSRAVEE